MDAVIKMRKILKFRSVINMLNLPFLSILESDQPLIKEMDFSTKLKRTFKVANINVNSITINANRLV